MKFWKDRWCKDLSLRDSFLDLYSIASSKDTWVVYVWDGGSWGSSVIRQFNDSEMEEVDAFLGGCIITPSLWVLMMLWFGWRLEIVLVKSFYSSLASRRA